MSAFLTRALALALACCAVLTACGDRSPAAPASPAVAAFQADRLLVAAGQSAELRWDVRGATHVFLDEREVGAAGRLQVSPAVTRVYTLRAVNAAGHATDAALTVDVQQAAAAPRAYPILFTTQVPLARDYNARLSAFASHLGTVAAAPRGGDLMLRYPDGTLRNLTREAGFGAAGVQGHGAIAVRDPAVHGSGAKAVFSMVVGAPESAGDTVRSVWQLYEVSGLARGERVRVVKVPSQPEQYNNLAPLYGSGGRILFTSDRPRDGQPHLYPQLDEYEAMPTVSGIWSLEPANGRLQLLTHTASGAFNPILDSYGRVLFTRWDHLQRDQLADRDRDATRNGVRIPFRSVNYADERAGAAALAHRDEIFPEPRAGSTGPYGYVNAYTSNFFTPWQMNEDGTGEETLNHIGLHELSPGFLTTSLRDDPALIGDTRREFHINRVAIRREGGLFQLREDPRQPGVLFATRARERDGFGTGQLVRLDSSPGRSAEQMAVRDVTAPDAGDAYAGGRYRNPLPLSDGRLVASHTTAVRAPEQGETLPDLRLRWLEADAKGLYRAGAPLTKGIRKSVSWWDGGRQQRYDGLLWELDAVEVRPRTQPVRAAAPLDAPERAIFVEAGVNEAQLRGWLVSRNLALIVTRNQTSRDRADTQQPYNLRVPGGVQTVSKERPGKVYDIAHFQLLQGDQVRGYGDRPGRRVLAQELHTGQRYNPAVDGAPAGSVKIAADGSTAAFVPAGRALTWQTTDPAGNAIVRERNWITFQAGEVRVCASCHGVNSRDQAGFAAPINKPEALRELLAHWKTIQNARAEP
ncbi:MAG TPA: hypothetical protein VIT92_14470 [Burkholderiaceae bacterium]